MNQRSVRCEMYSTHYDAETKLWSGRDSLPLYNNCINVAQALLVSMKTFGSKIAQVIENIYLTTFYES